MRLGEVEAEKDEAHKLCEELWREIKMLRQQIASSSESKCSNSHGNDARPSRFPQEKYGERWFRLKDEVSRLRIELDDEEAKASARVVAQHGIHL